MAGTGFAETTPYGNLECGRAKSGTKMVTLFGRWNKRLLFGKSLSGG